MMRLKNLIGSLASSDAGRLKRARIHQGWWRAFVLKQEQGVRPNNKKEKICNTVPVQDGYLGNFISSEIGELSLKIAEEHNYTGNESAGIIQIDRLKNNLLSSQPLCFNFFGMLSLDLDFGLKVIKQFFPKVSFVREVKFEYAPTPKKEFTSDNSAYDVAVEVEIGEQIGLIGIECKYTESFSPKEYSTERYKELYNASSNFVGSYEDLSCSKFNQLFRNQLIAESLIQSGRYNFVKTCLFCAADDNLAKDTAHKFSEMLREPISVITFFDLITAMQKQDLSAKQRKNTMLLWARYLGHELSDMAAIEY